MKTSPRNQNLPQRLASVVPVRKDFAKRIIEADFGSESADTFRRIILLDLRNDYHFADPPLNDADWFHNKDSSGAVV